MSKLSLIIKREFVAKVRNKSFIVMTFLSPLLFVGIAVFVGYLSTMKADLKTIAVHDQSGKFFSEFKSDEEYKYVDFSTINLQVLKDSIVSEAYEGLLVIPNVSSNDSLQKSIQYISNDSPSVMFISDIEEVINHKLTQENFQKAGLDTLDRRYISMLLERFEGRPTGVEALAAAMAEDSGTLEDVIEPYLIQQGYVMRTARGRIATNMAYLQFGMTPPE